MSRAWRSKALLKAPRIEPLRGKATTLAGDTPLVPGQPVSPVAAAGHWVTANASVETELRYPTGPCRNLHAKNAVLENVLFQYVTRRAAGLSRNRGESGSPAGETGSRVTLGARAVSAWRIVPVEVKPVWDTILLK